MHPIINAEDGESRHSLLIHFPHAVDSQYSDPSDPPSYARRTCGNGGSREEKAVRGKNALLCFPWNVSSSSFYHVDLGLVPFRQPTGHFTELSVTHCELFIQT